mmetsp:Transcript_60657/g.162734  ORF Transcript_60657/g.162734 Transcript_60657/m.162734 type:complete len:283 (-) Transcript_60657:160-1008(-)
MPSASLTGNPIACAWLCWPAPCRPPRCRLPRALGMETSAGSSGGPLPKNMFHSPPSPWGNGGDASSRPMATSLCPRRGFPGDIANKPESPPDSRDPVSSSPLPIFSGETPSPVSFSNRSSAACDGLTWNKSSKSDACSLLVASLASPSSKSWSDSGILVSTSILASKGPAPVKARSSPDRGSLPHCPLSNPPSISPTPTPSVPGRREIAGTPPDAPELFGPAAHAVGDSSKLDAALSHSPPLSSITTHFFPNSCCLHSKPDGHWIPLQMPGCVPSSVRTASS